MTVAPTAPRQPPAAMFVLAWLATCFILVVGNQASIAAFAFPDPDDTLRLLQVRDWLAGQRWYDVTQYRMNPPHGGDMHWSRLVDVPIAAIILLLRPFLGHAGAEHGAMILSPLLTLGVVTWLTAKLAERLVGRRDALLACCMLPLLLVVHAQLAPMRIDHHGWQMALALAATLAVIAQNRLRSGLWTGALLALWLNISLEGLAFTTVAMAALALRWVLDPAERDRFAAAVASLAASSLVLFLATRNPANWLVNHCDQVSSAHLALFGIGAVGTIGLTRLRLPALVAGDARGIAFRVGGLGAVGIAALATLLFAAPACSSGPFATLDPLVRELWYMRVLEGLPIWHQHPIIAGHVIGLPLIGLAGTYLRWRSCADETRTAWGWLFFLLIGALVSALLVQRSGAYANLLAIPGAVWLFRKAIDRAFTMRSPLKKVGAAFASMALLLPGQMVEAGSQALGNRQAVPASADPAARCAVRERFAALNALPPATIAAPFDIAPAIIEASHHRVIASGHHRNAAAMLDAVHMFVLPPDRALELMRARGVAYIVACPRFAEVAGFARHAPEGLWGQISAGRAPAWLHRVEVPGNAPMQVWRIDTAGPAA